MEWIENLTRNIGGITEDDQLTKGILTIGAGVLMVVVTVWRAFKPKPKGDTRVRIDAPATVRVIVDPLSGKDGSATDY